MQPLHLDLVHVAEVVAATGSLVAVVHTADQENQTRTAVQEVTASLLEERAHEHHAVQCVVPAVKLLKGKFCVSIEN